VDGKNKSCHDGVEVEACEPVPSCQGLSLVSTSSHRHRERSVAIQSYRLAVKTFSGLPRRPWLLVMTVEHYAIEPQRVMPALVAGIHVFENKKYLKIMLFKIFKNLY
jgi:hypothetical protein